MDKQNLKKVIKLKASKFNIMLESMTVTYNWQPVLKSSSFISHWFIGDS